MSPPEEALHLSLFSQSEAFPREPAGPERFAGINGHEKSTPKGASLGFSSLS